MQIIEPKKFECEKEIFVSLTELAQKIIKKKLSNSNPTPNLDENAKKQDPSQFNNDQI